MKAEKIHYSKPPEAVSISILYSKEAVVFADELRKTRQVGALRCAVQVVLYMADTYEVQVANITIT